jgi:hypothetical protein
VRRSWTARRQSVPESTQYINLKNGQIHHFVAGEGAPGLLLPVHDLSGAKAATTRSSIPRSQAPTAIADAQINRGAFMQEHREEAAGSPAASLPYEPPPEA